MRVLITGATGLIGGAVARAIAGAVLHGVATSATTSSLAAAASRAGALGVDEARERFGPFADALALDQRVSSARTRELLGWSPAHATATETQEA